MYEHYLLDDGAKAIDGSTAPKHYADKRTFIQTNFRESRDPFTRLPQDVMEALLDQASYDSATPSVKQIVAELLEAARAVEGTTTSGNAVDGKPAPSGIPQRAADDNESWLYNDYVYAKSYHEDFLDNDDFKNSTVHD